MTDSAPTTAERTTPQRHRVADFLTDEMRARVRAARFKATNSGVSADDGLAGRRCPLAIAVGMDCSMRSWVYRALGVNEPDVAVEGFMRWADSIFSNPADVYVMLGVDPPDGESEALVEDALSSGEGRRWGG